MAYNEFKTIPPEMLYVLRKGALYDSRVYAAYDKLEDMNNPEYLNECEVAVYKLDRVVTLIVAPPKPRPLEIKMIDKIFE